MLCHPHLFLSFRLANVVWREKHVSTVHAPLLDSQFDFSRRIIWNGKNTEIRAYWTFVVSKRAKGKWKKKKQKFKRRHEYRKMRTHCALELSTNCANWMMWNTYNLFDYLRIVHSWNRSHESIPIWILSFVVIVYCLWRSFIFFKCFIYRL